MRSITIRNYRCFGDEPQTARLAPLTLLIGENSSGKTSLMAMVRALWDVAYDHRVPDFKEDPYDLGSFEEIAHHRGARGGRAEVFEAGFESNGPGAARNGRASSGSTKVTVKFESQWSAPVPVSRRLERGPYWVDQDLRSNYIDNFKFGGPDGEWEHRDRRVPGEPSPRVAYDRIPPVRSLPFALESQFNRGPDDTQEIVQIGDSREFTREDLETLGSELFRHVPGSFPPRRQILTRPFASAPVRSQPQRVYSYDLAVADSLGDNTPSFLAQLALRKPDAWKALKEGLESFGRESRLFDEVRVRHLGKTDADPFQLQVRKFSNNAKGPFRNLVDVGYGISQVLPFVTELLKVDGPTTLLLQQPEVHLHPSAQAAVGSLFCDVAASSTPQKPRQLIVETHSDFIIDRVRMAVADETHPLRPADVALVYFERRGLDVALHSISIDASGNVTGAPQGYRQFFLDELQRSVGF